MKKSTKIIITISAVAAAAAALAAVSKYFCDFAMGTGEKSFRINDSLDSEGNEYKNTLHERRNNYREWLLNRSENIYLLTNDGVKVHALLTEHEERTHRYAIICHGYKNTSDDMGYQAYNFYNMGYNVLAPDGRASGKTAGKHGIFYSKRASVCLETQIFPDSPNRPEWPGSVLRPGETYSHRCIYKFSVVE